MSLDRKLKASRKRRAERVRTKTRNTGTPRICVFRSANHIYAQLIDDSQHKTLASCSSVELKELTGSKKEKAFAIGKELAQRALKVGIENAVFDRGAFLFHGRVAALTDGLREGGLRI
ncbi:50S ribosomal protein L18 [Candidatus Dependentiae bacterium]|nr:50S ribosomal protein L18 [Candidatus Dependentiae bacterium]